MENEGNNHKEYVTMPYSMLKELLIDLINDDQFMAELKEKWKNTT